MKRIILLSLAALIALSVMSCKKEIDPDNPFPGYELTRMYYEFESMKDVYICLDVAVPKKTIEGMSFTVLLHTDPDFPDDGNLLSANKVLTKYQTWPVLFKDLDPTKTYYCTAYYGDGTTKIQYPETLSFQPGIIDLGLSVKWAAVNIGAETVGDYGDYFAWGETEPKENYTGGANYTYSTTATSLTPEADVARVKWGGEWRMPTVAEIEELMENCEWMWATVGEKDTPALAVVRPGYHNQYLYFPAAGSCIGTEIGSGAGTYGSIWASNSTSRDVGVFSYKFTGSNPPIEVNLSSAMRITGRNVRAVCPQPK